MSSVKEWIWLLSGYPEAILYDCYWSVEWKWLNLEVWVLCSDKWPEWKPF